MKRKPFYPTGRGRFYHRRYFTTVEAKRLDESLNWPYWKANIQRRYVGWGRVNVIGFYSDYIRHVNDRMRPKRK